MITAGWAVIACSIILNTYFQSFNAPLSAPEFLVIFLASVLAGMILVDPETIVLSYFVLLALSIAILYVSITLPALLNVVGSAALGESLSDEAVSVIARSVFLYLLIPCLMGGILGGVVGERFKFR